ncbi:hypothetical protein J6590_069601 [Homalodisca vitripennis]|nr:hypothetical protein J6590_069601 [Homalodisca vitripennis]
MRRDTFNVWVPTQNMTAWVVSNLNTTRSVETNSRNSGNGKGNEQERRGEERRRHLVLSTMSEPYAAHTRRHTQAHADLAVTTYSVVRQEYS